MLVYGKYECFAMQMLYVCVHPVTVLNAEFCMTCNLLLLVEDTRGDHMEEAYSKAGLMTVSYVAMGVSFSLPHSVAASAFIICSGLCACTEMLSMCVLYVSFGSKVKTRTFGCVAMGSAVLFILRSRLRLYTAGSGVNRVQAVLSGISVKLFCCARQKLYVGIVYISWLHSCLCV